MGVEAAHKDDYRYPGTKFFEPDQQQIFFGREQETRDLLYSIKAYDVFVIFADSGIGKTSMLNAGLIPELEKEHYEPVKFRFQDVAIPPLQIAHEELSDYVNPAVSDTPDAPINLWRLFKACNFKGKTPLFIFDQFEEFFNHSKINREHFINELAGLINDYLPDAIREEMKAKFRENDPTPEQVKYYTPAHVKLLFLIRADKLKLLDDLSVKIPFILRNRFYLRPLTGKQAEQAILLPALLPKNGFIAPPFNYEEDAVSEICKYLKNEEGEVESFQLQILCRELEKRIITRSEKKEKGLWIRKEELGGEAGMDAITKNYYTNQIEAIPDPAMQVKAINLIEEELIVENRRISLPEIFLTNEGYSKELLEYLLNTTRIIRAYNDRNSRYYEISHDRLLPSILKLKQQRHEEETRLEELRELERLKNVEEVKNAELKKEKDVKKRFRRISILMAMLCLVLIGSYIYFIHSDTKAKITNASYFIAAKNYDRARQVLDARNVFSFFNFANRDTLKKLSDTTNLYLQTKERYEDNVSNADSLLYSGQLLVAIADSLLYKADALAGTNELSQLSNDTIYSETLIKALDVSNSFTSARKLCIEAQKSVFYSKDENIESKLKSLDSLIATSFEQNVNAIIVFNHADMNKKADEISKKADRIITLAASDSIFLKPKAIEALDSLKKVLKQ